MKNAYWPLSVAAVVAFEIITVALFVCVESVVDVAIIVTLPPVGAADGAVYTVVAPFIVAVGLNDPQAPAGAQLQFTGVGAGSFAAAAAIDAVPLASSDAGGSGVVNDIVIAGPVIVTLALFVFVPSATDVAVIVTIPSAMGAV